MAVSPRIRAVSAILSCRLDQHDVDDAEESRLRSSLARLNIRLDSLQSRPSPNTYGPISSGNLRDNSRGNGQNVVFENQPTLPNPILLTQDQWVQQQQLQFSAKLQHQHSYPTNTTDSTVQYLQATSGPQIVSQTPIVSAQYVPQQTLGPASTQSNYYQAQMSIRPMMHEQASPSLQPQYYVQPMPPAITVPLGRIPQQQLYPRDPSYVPAIIQPPPPYQAYPLQQSFVPPISNVATQFAARVIMPTAGVSAAYYSNATAAPTTSTVFHPMWCMHSSCYTSICVLVHVHSLVYLYSKNDANNYASVKPNMFFCFYCTYFATADSGSASPDEAYGSDVKTRGRCISSNGQV